MLEIPGYTTKGPYDATRAHRVLTNNDHLQLKEFEELLNFSLAADKDLEFPKAIRWILRNILYQPDPVDEWRTPADTLTTGAGDCEDQAALACAWMRHRGLTTYILLVFDDLRDSYHALGIGISNVHHMRSEDGGTLTTILDHMDKVFIFDNLHAMPLRAEHIRRLYRPVIIYSAVCAWRYKRIERTIA